MRRPLEDTESCAAFSRLASCGLSRTVWSIATATHPPYFVGTLCSICDRCPDARPLQPAAHKTSCLQLLQVCAAFQPVFGCNPKSWLALPGTAWREKSLPQGMLALARPPARSERHHAALTGWPTALRPAPSYASSMRSRHANTGSSASSRAVGLTLLAIMKKLNTMMSAYSGAWPPRNGCLPSVARSGSSAARNADSLPARSPSGQICAGRQALGGQPTACPAQPGPVCNCQPSTCACVGRHAVSLAARSPSGQSCTDGQWRWRVSQQRSASPARARVQVPAQHMTRAAASRQPRAQTQAGSARPRCALRPARRDIMQDERPVLPVSQPPVCIGVFSYQPTSADPGHAITRPLAIAVPAAHGSQARLLQLAAEALLALLAEEGLVVVGEHAVDVQDHERHQRRLYKPKRCPVLHEERRALACRPAPRPLS